MPSHVVGMIELEPALPGDSSTDDEVDLRRTLARLIGSHADTGASAGQSHSSRCQRRWSATAEASARAAVADSGYVVATANLNQLSRELEMELQVLLRRLFSQDRILGRS